MMELFLVNDTLGELEGLLASQQFDYMLVAGDFNTDISHKTTFSKALLDFADYHVNHRLQDISLPDDICALYRTLLPQPPT